MCDLCDMCCVCAQAQLLFFSVLLISLANYFVGTVIPANEEKQATGFFSYRSEFRGNIQAIAVSLGGTRRCNSAIAMSSGGTLRCN